MYRLPLSFSQAGVGFHKVRCRHSINGVGQMVCVHDRKHVANQDLSLPSPTNALLVT